MLCSINGVFNKVVVFLEFDVQNIDIIWVGMYMFGLDDIVGQLYFFKNWYIVFDLLEKLEALLYK